MILKTRNWVDRKSIILFSNKVSVPVSIMFESILNKGIDQDKRLSSLGLFLAKSELLIIFHGSILKPDFLPQQIWD